MIICCREFHLRSLSDGMGTRSNFLDQKIFKESYFIPLVKISCKQKLGHGQLIRRHFEYPRLVVRELQVTVQELNAVHVQFGAVLCIRVT